MTQPTPVTADTMVLFSCSKQDENGVKWYGNPLGGVALPTLPAELDGEFVLFASIRGHPNSVVFLALEQVQPNGATRRIPPQPMPLGAVGAEVMASSLTGLSFDVYGVHTFRLLIGERELAILHLTVMPGPPKKPA